jgi:MarR family transcriptional regulator for hemolysin
VNDNALIELLWSINRKLSKRLAPLAQKEGLSLTELVLLRKTHLDGERRVTSLAEELCVPPSTLTGMMDRLVDSGWLARDRDPDDRRAVVVKGTPKLDELIRSLMHASSRVLEKALKTLPHVTRERLAGDLASLLQCLEQEERVE